MEFNKYNNRYGYLFDEVEKLVMYGYQVSWEISSSAHLVIVPKLSTPYHVYIIENNTKYSIEKRSSRSEYWGLIRIIDGYVNP